MKPAQQSAQQSAQDFGDMANGFATTTRAHARRYTEIAWLNSRKFVAACGSLFGGLRMRSKASLQPSVVAIVESLLGPDALVVV